MSGHRKTIDVELAVNLYMSGITLKEIGKALGVSRVTVSNRLREIGVLERTDLISRTEKQCIVCNEIKPIDLYYKAGCSSGSIDEYRNICVVCFKGQELLRRFGINLKEYEQILHGIQNGFCVLCGLEAPTIDEMLEGRFWPVDHDHSCCPGAITCGKCVRGILCDSCNVSITSKWQNEQWRIKAITYMESRLSPSGYISVLAPNGGII